MSAVDSTRPAQADAAPSASTGCSCSPNPPLPDHFSTQADAAAVAVAADAATPSSDSDDAVAAAAAASADSATEPAVSAKWAALLKPSAASPPAAAPALSFEWSRHVNYFSMHLRSIPQGYESLDTSRITMLYFCLSALDVLGALQTAVVDKGMAPKIIDWIYAQQVLPPPVSDAAPQQQQPDYSRCGFRGGSSLGVAHDPRRKEGLSPAEWGHDEAHIAMTYTALCCLRILGDSSFERLDRRACIGALRSLQQQDGSFSSTCQRSESDMRFLYCACAISSLLQDWSGFDQGRAIRFIVASQSYDGGIGLGPGCEGHGGSTYTAIAALTLMGQMDALPSVPALLKWCINNQCIGESGSGSSGSGSAGGFRGRPNKPEDCCYSFWIGASLVMLGQHLKTDVYAWTNPAANRAFNLQCQSAKYGGFSKEAGPYHPDLLHSYFGVAGLSLMGIDKDKLGEIDVVLGMTKRAVAAAAAAAEQTNGKDKDAL